VATSFRSAGGSWTEAVILAIERRLKWTRSSASHSSCSSASIRVTSRSRDARLGKIPITHTPAPADLLVLALQGIGRVDLPPVLGGEGHVGEDLLLGPEEQLGGLRTLRSRDPGDLAQKPERLGLGALGEDRLDHREHHHLAGFPSSLSLRPPGPSQALAAVFRIRVATSFKGYQTGRLGGDRRVGRRGPDGRTLDGFELLSSCLLLGRRGVPERIPGDRGSSARRSCSRSPYVQRRNHP
jgi:hypothetical protein